MSVDGHEAGTARAWGWVAHLRDGGTTPWSQWSASGEPRGRALPGAQQLELLRRLNLSSARPVEPCLADRVLRADAPGRGLPDLELVGAKYDDRFGPPPVDPSELPDEEVLRPAAHLLAQDLVAMGPVPRPEVRQWPWRRRVVVVGDPWMRTEVQQALRAAGRAPRPDGQVVVVGASFTRMLADAWTHACFDRPVVSWPEWLALWQQRQGLPQGLDLASAVEHWSRRAGAERVQLVLDERDLPQAVGHRRLPPVRRPGRTAAGVARRVAYSLNLLAPADQHRDLLRHGLLPRLPDDCFDAGLPVVPEEERAWVAARADRVAGRLRRAGYPVPECHAPSDDLLAGPEGGGATDALALVVRLLLGGWKGQE